MKTEVWRSHSDLLRQKLLLVEALPREHLTKALMFTEAVQRCPWESIQPVVLDWDPEDQHHLQRIYILFSFPNSQPRFTSENNMSNPRFSIFSGKEIIVGTPNCLPCLKQKVHFHKDPQTMTHSYFEFGLRFSVTVRDILNICDDMNRMSQEPNLLAEIK